MLASLELLSSEVLRRGDGVLSWLSVSGLAFSCGPGLLESAEALIEPFEQNGRRPFYRFAGGLGFLESATLVSLGSLMVGQHAVEVEAWTALLYADTAIGTKRSQSSW